MHRIDRNGAAAAPPTLIAAEETPGYFTEGDPQQAIPATVVSQDWLNDVQENIAYVIEQAGIALVKGTWTQLRTAITHMIQNVQEAIQTIANNTTNGNVTAALFVGTTHPSFKIEFDLYRKTDTPTELRSSGVLKGLYKPVLASWTLILESESGDELDVEFNITSGGQVRYTSSNLAGANYVGQMRFKISRFTQS